VTNSGSIPVNQTLLSLIALARKYPREEKILIVRNYHIGQQILENVAKIAPWTNYRVKSVEKLALELVEDVLIVEDLEAISYLGTQTIIDNIFCKLSDEGKLKYFEKHPVNKGIVEALSRTIQELRMQGVNSSNLKKGYFVNPEKEKDIKLILSAYEKELKEQKFIDKAGILELALKVLEKGPSVREAKYLVFSRHYMRGIEREFINKIGGDNLIVIPEDNVLGLPLTSDVWETDYLNGAEIKTNIERLRWLFASKKAPAVIKDDTVSFFHAIGYRNEIHEVVRRIIKNKRAVDEVEVVYTNTDGYADLIYSTCEKLGIPVTFSDGIGSHMVNTGRIMMAFLLWIKEDFSEIHFQRILESGGLKQEGTSALAYLLRTSGVGWGRERYPLVLGKKISETKKEAEALRNEGEKESAEYKEEKIKKLEKLKELSEKMLKLVPEVQDKKINFTELCKGCTVFLEQYISIVGDNDVAFIDQAKEKINMLGRLINGEILFDEAIEKLIETVASIRVRSSKPMPGHLHVSHYSLGGKSGRSNTFVVGLDERKFPLKIVQDPILLDGEREKMGIGLEISSEKIRKNLYDMAGLFAGLRGKVTVSYPCFDVKEDRKVFPSSLVLQVFRIKEGKPGADYNDLFNELGEPIGFVEGVQDNIFIDETDWWVSNLAEEGVLKDGKKMIKLAFQGIKEGLIADENRNSNIFTKYDGKIEPYSGDLTIRNNEERVVSCSRLELAAKCPYAYFIENVLKIRKPDETIKEPGVWLDAAERGSLLHEVFKEFIDRIKSGKKQLNTEKQQVLIEEILDRWIKKYKEEIPPPNESILQNEVVQLKRDIKVFIQINESIKTDPVGTEILFGAEPGTYVKIKLADGKEILLRGKIDRLDKAGKSEYHVWDYKTGSAYLYDEHTIVAKGEQLQPWLYAEAAEEIMKRNGDTSAEVTASGYLTPTEKGTGDGKGGIFPRSTDNKKWQEALDKILNLIENGYFIISNEKDACTFCDYSDICGGEKAKTYSNNKLSNDENKELAWWKELKKYE